jgi:hypothetical protein
VHIELGGLSVVRVDPTRLDSKRDVPSVTPNVTTLIKEESHQNSSCECFKIKIATVGDKNEVTVCNR